MSLKKTGLRAISWDFLGKLLRHGTELIISIFLCRLLNPEDFGLIGMAGVFIVLSSTFVDFNLSAGLINKQQSTQEQYSTVFFLNLILALLLTSVFLWAAPLAGMFYKNSAVTTVLRVLAFGPLIHASCCVQQARFIKKLDFKSLTLSDLAGAIISGPFGIIAAIYGFGVWALVIQYYIAALVRTFEIWRRSEWRPSFLFSIKSIRSLWIYGSNLFFTGLIDNLFSKLDILIIGKMFSPSVLGYYNKAKSFNEFIIKYVSSGLASVLFPFFSQIQADTEQVRFISVKSLHVVSFLSFGLTGLFYLITEDLIIVLYGQKWIPSIPYYRIIILMGYAYPVSSILSNIIKGRGRSDYLLRAEIIKKFVLGIGIVVGFIFGLNGYLWSMVFVAFISTVFINGYYVEKEIGYKRRDLFFCLGKYFLLASFCVLALSFTHNMFVYKTIRLLAFCVFFIITYCLLNRLLSTQGWTILGNEMKEITGYIPSTVPMGSLIRKIVIVLFR